MSEPRPATIVISNWLANCQVGQWTPFEAATALKAALTKEGYEIRPAAKPERERVIEWQPIETAPKDGTEILGLCDWEPCTAVLFYQSGDWLVRWDHSKFSGGFEATHWIPIPALKGDPASTVAHLPNVVVTKQEW